MRVAPAGNLQGDYSGAAAEYEQIRSSVFPSRSSCQVPHWVRLDVTLKPANGPTRKPGTPRRENSNRNGSGETSHWLARVALETSDPQQAIAEARSAMEKLDASDPWRSKLLLDIADSLYAQPDRREDAMQAYLRLANKFAAAPEAGQALYNAAYAALELGKLTGSSGVDGCDS